MSRLGAIAPTIVAGMTGTLPADKARRNLASHNFSAAATEVIETGTESQCRQLARGERKEGSSDVAELKEQLQLALARIAVVENTSVCGPPAPMQVCIADSHSDSEDRAVAFW